MVSWGDRASSARRCPRHRPHGRARRSHLCPPASRLGGRRHPRGAADRPGRAGFGGRAGGGWGRPTRPRLPASAPQQAVVVPEPEGAGSARRAAAPGRYRRCADREHASAGQEPPGFRLRHRPRAKPASGLWVDLGLRSGRPLWRPGRRRPDRPGDGRPDERHRATGHRADARRHSRGRPGRRSLPRRRRAGRAARPEPDRGRALGADVPAGIDDRDDGLPGRPLDDRSRGAGAGGQPSPDGRPDGLFRLRRRIHQCRGRVRPAAAQPVPGDRPSRYPR